ncbi:MAG: chloride channel protein [Verrucomicrobiota bacterium]
MPAWLHALPDWLRHRFSDNQRFLILCTVAGVCCGLAAVAFHLSIEWTFHTVWEMAVSLGPVWFWIVMPLLPAVGGLLVGLCLWKLSPESAGSGIPQTKAAFYNDFGQMKIKDGFFRFLLGTIYIGFGNALGREGPTVHMCASIASKLGQWAGLAKARVQAMVPVGMGAGIAAAFNAPLSAIFFVFEELLADFSTKALGGIVIAVVVAAAVSRSILGEDPVLQVGLREEDIVTAWWMLISLPLGIASGFIGALFVNTLIKVRGSLRQWDGMAVWLKPAAGGLAMGLVGAAAFAFTGLFGEAQNGVFSIGYNSLELAFEAKLVGAVLIGLFIFKFIAVLICYATGGSGGLFSPTLFLGGMLGGLFGVVLVYVHNQFGFFNLPDEREVIGACVLLGMGAMFAAIVRCPITSLVIIFEMTRNYSFILPLIAGNMIAYFISAKQRALPLYDSLLIQDGVTLRKMPNYQGVRDYQNLPISTIMTHDTVAVDGSLNSQQNLDKLERTHHGYPVLKADGSLCGMIMHHELLEHVEHGIDTPLAELLKEQKVISVNPDTSIRNVAALLIKEDVLQVPVVSQKEDSKLLGIVTLHDIARQQNTITEQVGR